VTKETPAQYLVLWAIMADQRLSAAAKCVATVLLLRFRNHKTNQCNPSFGELAKCVGRTRRPVIEALNELKKFGWLDWTGTKGGSPANTNDFKFFLNPQPVLQTAPVLNTTPVLNSAPTGAVHDAQPVLQTAHELSKNHLNHRSAARLQGREGFRVHTESQHADHWRRYWVTIGKPEPAFSRRDGYYLEPLPSLLPPEPAESAA
jgi:hypothetical protein